MAPKIIILVCSHSCAFAYATANCALYAVLVGRFVEYWADWLESRFGERASLALLSDTTVSMLIALLLVALLVSNHVSYARRVALLFRPEKLQRDSLRAIPQSSLTKKVVLERAEKLCSIGGTYLKTIASTISLAQLVASYSNDIVGMCIALPQLPMNAVAQFAIIGEQFTIRLLVFALLALLETMVLSGLTGGVAYAVNAESGVIALEIAVLFVLLSEMIVLAAFDMSLCVASYVRLAACVRRCRNDATANESIVVVTNSRRNREGESLLQSGRDDEDSTSRTLVQ